MVMLKADSLELTTACDVFSWGLSELMHYVVLDVLGNVLVIVSRSGQGLHGGAEWQGFNLIWKTAVWPQFHLYPSSFPVSSGWGEMPSVHSKAENSWGEPSSPSPLVDNGTAAWGKPPSSGSGWDHPAEPVVPFGRASAPAAAPALCKPGKISLLHAWTWQLRNGSCGCGDKSVRLFDVQIWGPWVQISSIYIQHWRTETGTSWELPGQLA